MTPNNRPRLADYLPVALREDPALSDLLLAFETLLLDSAELDHVLPRGLERIIDDIPRYFTAGLSGEDGAPDNFLPWLGRWVALSLRTDISDDPKQNAALRRRFIGGIAAIYPYRGTKRSLRELLGLFTERSAEGIRITESADRRDHFSVTLDLTDKMLGKDQEEIDRLWEVADAVIHKEKPAHTWFTLIPDFPTFRLGPLPVDNPLRAQVGGRPEGGRIVGNTRLGSARWDQEGGART